MGYLVYDKKSCLCLEFDYRGKKEIYKSRDQIEGKKIWVLDYRARECNKEAKKERSCYMHSGALCYCVKIKYVGVAVVYNINPDVLAKQWMLSHRQMTAGNFEWFEEGYFSIRLEKIA